MSNQPQQEHEHPKIVTPEELRQSILTELEARKQEIVDLSNEQLMEITGGFIPTHIANEVMVKTASMVGGAFLGALASMTSNSIHQGAAVGIGASAGLATAHFINQHCCGGRPQPAEEPGHVELGTVQGHAGTGQGHPGIAPQSQPGPHHV
jgi:hypothetical protein